MNMCDTECWGETDGKARGGAMSGASNRRRKWHTIRSFPPIIRQRSLTTTLMFTKIRPDCPEIRVTAAFVVDRRRFTSMWVVSLLFALALTVAMPPSVQAGSVHGIPSSIRRFDRISDFLQRNDSHGSDAVE